MTSLGTDLIPMHILGKTCKDAENMNGYVYDKFNRSIPVIMRQLIRLVLPVNLLNNPTALGGEIKKY